MNNKTFIEKLKELDACNDAVEWCKSHGGTLEELWRDCERGNWMLWLLREIGTLNEEQYFEYVKWCTDQSALAEYASSNSAATNRTDYDVYYTHYGSYAVLVHTAYAAYADLETQAEYIRKNFNCPEMKECP